MKSASQQHRFVFMWAGFLYQDGKGDDHYVPDEDALKSAIKLLCVEHGVRPENVPVTRLYSRLDKGVPFTVLDIGYE